MKIEYLKSEMDEIELKKRAKGKEANTPYFIAGAVNIRGRIYSVMHVGHFLGITTPPISENAHVPLVRGREDNRPSIMGI